MKHRTQRLLGALAFSLLSMPMFAQLSGTYTIDATGTGTNNYTSFGAAVTALTTSGVSGAVTFNVASGTYTEQVNLGAVTGASSTNTITFQGSTTAASTLTYTPAGFSDNWTVKMTGTDYITFDNMTITSGGSSYARLIVYTDTVTNFNLTNCHLIGKTSSGGSTSSNYAGLYYAYPAVAAGNWHISDNTFDSVTYAIYVYGLGYGAGQGADSVFVEDNTINANYNGFYVRYAKYQKMHDNVINDINGQSLRNYAYYPVYELDVQNNQVNDASYGIYMYSAPPTSGATGGIKVNVSNNHFEGNYYGIRVGGSGSSTTEKITDLTIENNTIEAWGTSYNYGIYLGYVNAPTTARAKVQNNMIALNTTSTTGTLYGIYPYHCANVDMFHNSIAANGGSLTNSRLIYLNHSSSSSYFTPGGNSLKNNAVANLNGGKCVIGQSATTGSAAYCETGTNLFYTTNTTPHSNFTPGSTDLTGDPMYINPLTDLHAQAQVADNAGAPLGVLTDIDGDTRSTTTPDIGADEFAYVSQCFAPTGVATSNVTASSFDASWSSANTAIGYHARAWAAGTTTYTYSSGTAGPASFTGLSANTSYSVEVREICAVGDTSAWSSAGSATTSCAPTVVTTAAPFAENFDSAPWAPNTTGYGSNTWDNCWDASPMYSGTSDYAWMVQTGGTPSSSTGPLGANSGSNYLYTEGSYGAMGSQASVHTPSLVLSVTNPELSFAYHLFGASLSGIWVDVSTDGGSTFTTVDSVTTLMTAQNAPWGLHYTSLSSYAGDTVIVALRTVAGTSFTDDAALDDISVGQALTCFPATSLATTGETSSSFDAAWTTGNASAIGYEIHYSVDLPTPSWMSVTGTGTTATVGGLTSGTQYIYKVREICSVGDTAAWSTPAYATTNFCAPQFQCAVTAKLFDSYGDGWNGGTLSIEQKNAAGQWVAVATFGSGFNSLAGSPPGDTLIEYGNVCDGDSARLILSAAGSYQKEMGWFLSDANGDTIDYQVGSNSGINDPTGTVYGSGVASCPSTCPNTDSLVIDDETSCGVSSVEFHAAGAGMDNHVVWLDGNGAAIGLGEHFETDPISANTTVQATSFAANNLTAPHHFGPSNTLSGGFGNYSNGMWFSATTPFHLDSITVKSNGLVDFQVRISEGGGNKSTGHSGAELLLSDTIRVDSAGTWQVPVGLVIMPGTYYINMKFATGTPGKLHRATGGGAYPYTVANVASIDSVQFGSTNSRVYYAYDWVIREGCTSPVATGNAIYAPVPDSDLPYLVDFNNGLPCNWDWDSITDQGWEEVSNFGGNSIDSTDFMFINDDAVGSAAPPVDASITSPMMYAIGYDSLWLEFDHYYRQAGTAGLVEVYDGSNWVQIDSIASTVGSWSAPMHEKYDISMYQNTDLMVRLRYTDGAGAWGWYWAVDNFHVNGTLSPCTDVRVELLTDIYGSEITWDIVDVNTGQVWAAGGPYPNISPYNAANALYVDTLCLPDAGTYEFRIEDSYGDGLDDGTNAGWYQVDVLCPWGDNNVLTIDTSLTAVNGAPWGAMPYGSTTNTPMYDSTVFTTSCVQYSNVTFQVDMNKVDASTFTTPELNATFNNWCGNCNAMSDADGDNVWDITLPLEEGSTIEYKYSADGWTIQEMNDPNASCTNGNVTYTNRVLTIPAADTVLPVVCWSSCDACAIEVTLSVNMAWEVANGAIDSSGVHVAGTWQSWNPAGSQMLDTNGDGVYHITFSSALGETLQYKFINGMDWNSAEPTTDLAACGVSDGFGGYNRTATLGNADTVFAPVCFGKCYDCAVSIDEALGSVSLFPNPTSGAFTLERTNLIGDVEVSIIGLRGELLNATKWDSGSSELNIDLSDLASGIYMVRLTADEGTRTMRVAVQR